MFAFVLLAAAADPNPPAFTVENRCAPRFVVVNRTAPAPPVRGAVVVAAPPVFAPAAPVCVGGVCSVPQASAPLENGWYPGKLLGRRR